jgi:hypothetical protein
MQAEEYLKPFMQLHLTNDVIATRPSILKRIQGNDCKRRRLPDKMQR